MNRTACSACGFGGPQTFVWAGLCVLIPGTGSRGRARYWEGGFQGQKTATEGLEWTNLRGLFRAYTRPPLGIPEITGSDSEEKEVRSGQ